MAEADLKPEAPGNRKTRQENFYTFKKIKKSRYIDATFRRNFLTHISHSMYMYVFGCMYRDGEAVVLRKTRRKEENGWQKLQHKEISNGSKTTHLEN